MSTSTPTPTRTPLRDELRALHTLALPLVASQLGSQLLSFVDSVMVGRLGAVSLGAVGIGNSIFFSATIVGIGCLFGMDPLTSQALGAGERGRARRVLQDGLRLATWLSLPLMLAVVLSSYVLTLAGVNPNTAHEVQRYLIGRAPNTWPLLLFIAARSYLQAHQRTRPIIVATVLANVVNFIGNALLIYGDDALVRVGLGRIGLPALGIFGAGLSSTLASAAAVVVLWLAIRDLDTPEVHAAAATAEPLGRAILRLGVPLGLQLAAEVGLFAVASVLAGRISAQAAAAHSVAITLASCTFTVTVGIGAATSVRVGHFVGRDDTPGARRAGLTGLIASAAFMSLSALVFIFAPTPLARVVTDDLTVVHAAIPLLAIAAVFQLSDGTQAVASGALRGAGDTRASFIANVLGHWLIGLPVAIGLGFGAHMGAPGLWWGLSAGLTVVAIALTARFLHISARPIVRV
ncbi:MAG TPA: MATE family efflux transporter [Polyangia bacterium]|jgi:MATE family multidrug resistance protein|nr:MATE family efflux transporter [Polyangia bacterium]